MIVTFSSTLLGMEYQTFTNDKGEKIEWYYISLSDKDAYRIEDKIFVATMSVDSFKKVGLKMEKLPEIIGKEFAVTANLSVQGGKVRVRVTDLTPYFK